VNPVSEFAASVRRRIEFRGSTSYWQKRYARGGNSGAGSSGPRAAFKAEFVNQFVVDHAIRSVLEFGCGDGGQLVLARYPAYTGLDISASAVRSCIGRFSGDLTKSFFAYDPTAFANRGALTAELVLSLDVIFHLVEDEVFVAHMRDLFRAAERYVVVYSTDEPSLRDTAHPHVRNRAFTSWVASNVDGWRLVSRVPSPPEVDAYVAFVVYERLPA
jgi:SAM-dependent methyltransferase